MRTRSTAVAVALIVTACGSADTTTQTPDSSASATVSTTTTTTAAPSTTESTMLESTTTAPDAEVRTDRQLGVQIPPNLVVLDVASYDNPIVYGFVDEGGGGGLQEHVLWNTTEPFESATSIASLFPESDFAPEVTQVVELNGRYVAFTMGDVRSQAMSPTVLTSTDGVDWTAAPIGPLLQPAGYRSALTPDSPPYPGKSAIVDALVDENLIVATGWATVGSEIVPAVWTFDGRVWSIEVIDIESDFGNLYGTQVATTGDGLIVRIGGPVHTGITTVIETPAGWTSIEPFDDQGSPEEVAGNDLFLYRLVLPVVDGKPILLWSDDRFTWSPSPLPVVEGADPFRWRLEASSWHDPIVWQETYGTESTGADIWTLDRGLWERTELDGDRVVTADHELLVSQSDGWIFVVDRRGP